MSSPKPRAFQFTSAPASEALALQRRADFS
jgi:hypothetical protein